jgi:hypothetical protein
MTLFNETATANNLTNLVYVAGYDGRVIANAVGWESRELEVANVMVAIVGTLQTMLREVPELLRVREGHVHLVGIDAGEDRVVIARAGGGHEGNWSDAEWARELRALVAGVQ